MKKMFSFLAGMMSGAVVGAVSVLLLTPMSGSELQDDVKARVAATINVFNETFEESYQGKMAEFEQMKSGGQAPT